jgi:uncharacterized membrane protein (UPF0127 family)
MIIKYKNKRFDVKVKRVSELGKISGLMFRTKKTKNLLFDFSKNIRLSIHSFFVFFKFLIIWLDKDNKVQEYRIVRPFTVAVLPKETFRKFIELPLNRENKSIIDFFVDKRKV